MNNDNNLVKVQDENGKVIDMLILKEFDYKNRKYAVLGEMDYCKCDCDDECDCNNDCDCDDECDCNNDCDCDNECHCNESDELTLCLLEITKDKDGNEIFKSIDDEKLFDELVDEADRVMYDE